MNIPVKALCVATCKSLRDGMGADNTLTRDNGVLDLVITNVTIIDAIQVYVTPLR